MLDPAFLAVKFLDDLLVSLVPCKQVPQNDLLCYFPVTELIKELLPTDVHHFFQVLVDCAELPSMGRPHFLTHHDLRLGNLFLSDFGLADFEGGVEEGLGLRGDIAIRGTAVQIAADLKLGKSVDISVL